MFEENYSLLAAIFTQKGMLHLETFLELSKDEFINILIEAGILQEKEEEEKHEGEVKRKFTKQTILINLSNVFSFDP
jgi:hypothetical protein